MENKFAWVSYLVAALTALVYGVKVWDDLSHPDESEDGKVAEVPNKASLFRNCIYSAFGSGVVCLLVCEGLLWKFENMPFSVALLCGAMAGFIGADKFKDLFVKLIASKFKIGG